AQILEGLDDAMAAAVAECRRLEIEVRPPNVHQSHVEFKVEGQAIRFGLLAVKNVGQGAIESIIAARTADGPFKSLTDFCTRIDLRLANRKILESLAKVGALSEFGHPAQILEGLDDAMAAAQATQRDRISGQTSFFDMGATDATALERPLPPTPEAPGRERLRWEKELLGLYLSEHPMGEVADKVGDFVTAYSSDLKDESLDGQRLVVGGIVIGIRSIITRARATMAAVTIEDLQGSIEIIVFPKLYEQTGPIWAEGSILLVAGRVDHRGEDVSILADQVTTWDEAVVKGPEAFAREVAAGDRGAFRRRPAGGPNGATGDSTARTGNGNGGYVNGSGRGAVAPVRRPESAPAPAGRPATARRADIPYVSPLRPDAEPVAGLPSIAPAEPIPTYAGAGPTNGSVSDRDEEPALPDEARARAAEAVVAPTIPLEAPGTNQVMHVRFGGAPPEKLVRAMETFRQLTRERPGDTRVVVHVPAPGGSALPMELKQTVAYDAELLAEVARRLGEGVVQISLS
ncbi:MAG: OB-fold nucleic acid binding domain-containing protein, partial [Candidatus Limnocylindrales bacterium]